MAAKSILFLTGVFFLSASTGWCEIVPAAANETVQAKVEEKMVNATADQPDPYKNVTWDSVTNKDKAQDQTVTVYSPGNRGADFVTVSSTGSAPSNVAVVVPATKRPKRWFFW